MKNTSDKIQKKLAIIIPLANEEETITELVEKLENNIEIYYACSVFFILDNSSKDSTLKILKNLVLTKKFIEILWMPNNENVVDAYLNGYKAAYNLGFDYFIEMDGGLSHDPNFINKFILELKNGIPCVFGVRTNNNSPLPRRLLSSFGTIISNIFLGTKVSDMTSGFQAFNREIVGKIIQLNIRSKGHFYQTEIRYLLKNFEFKEIKITYFTEDKFINFNSFFNAIKIFLYYFSRRLILKDMSIR